MSAVARFDTSDTSTAAQAVLAQVFRRMSPADKAAIVEPTRSSLQGTSRC